MIARPQYFATKLATSAAVVLCMALLALSRNFYDGAMVDGFFALALGSVVILHLRIRPKGQDAVLIAFSTAAMGWACFHWLQFPYAVMAWFSFAGLASFLLLALRIIWEDDRRLLLSAWIPAVLFASSEYFASTMLAWTAAAHPRTLDLYLLLFDASLRFQPAFLAGRIYATNLWLHNASLIAYVGLAVPITMVFAGQLLRNHKQAFPAMLAFLVTGPIGVIFYNFFPAAGPHNLFGHRFPFTPLPYERLVHVILEPVAILGPRNAMPSLHMAWTLLAWWYSQGLSWFERAIAFAFLALTGLATMGTGEHWLIDLVVAVPFALMIQALCAYNVSWRDARRFSAFLLGLLATVGWMVLLRYATRLFWTSPVVPWALVLATVALTSIRHGILQNAEPLLVPASPRPVGPIGSIDLPGDGREKELSEAVLGAAGPAPRGA